MRRSCATRSPSMRRACLTRGAHFTRVAYVNAGAHSTLSSWKATAVAVEVACLCERRRRSAAKLLGDHVSCGASTTLVRLSVSMCRARRCADVGFAVLVITVHPSKRSRCRRSTCILGRWCTRESRVRLLYIGRIQLNAPRRTWGQAQTQNSSELRNRRVDKGRHTFRHI